MMRRVSPASQRAAGSSSRGLSAPGGGGSSTRFPFRKGVPSSVMMLSAGSMKAVRRSAAASRRGALSARRRADGGDCRPLDRQILCPDLPDWWCPSPGNATSLYRETPRCTGRTDIALSSSARSRPGHRAQLPPRRLRPALRTLRGSSSQNMPERTLKLRVKEGMPEARKPLRHGPGAREERLLGELSEEGLQCRCGDS